ncbi:hypothetical protein DL768_011878 [Monosporascus sp. mg162]|nr:hypothetical protein DL768_011878 [Monosporascus sp. mg162]
MYGSKNDDFLQLLDAWEDRDFENDEDDDEKLVNVIEDLQSDDDFDSDSQDDVFDENLQQEVNQIFATDPATPYRIPQHFT